MSYQQSVGQVIYYLCELPQDGEYLKMTNVLFPHSVNLMTHRRKCYTISCLLVFQVNRFNEYSVI